MRRGVVRKWRPPLWFVLGGTLAAVFLLPLIGIAYFRVAGGALGWAETSWMIFWMAFAATALLGWLLWRLVLHPVRALTSYAQSVTKGESGNAPVHFGTPEFSRLGQSVLQMSGTLQDREAVVRSYADHVTHELKSPLTVISGAAELLSDPTLSAGDRTELLNKIEGSVGRMQVLLEAQRDLARARDPMPPGACRLSEAVSGIARVAQDGKIPLPELLAQLVFGHLISNAQSQGADRVDISLVDGQVIVSDNGAGISTGNCDKVFDPFFTTRRADGGTGMGLPIVRRMLEAQGAGIDLVQPQPEQGAAFVIWFSGDEA